MPMRRNTLAVVGGLALVLVSAAVAPGAAAEAPPGPLQTPKLTEAARRGWLRARIVSGRIKSGATRLGNMNEPAKEGGQRQERLRISIVGQELSVNYELTTPAERLLIEITGPDKLHVRRSPEGESGTTVVDFRQSEDEPLRLAVGPDDEQQVYTAASLWHLLITQPQVSRAHLVPLLQPLDQQWDLAGMADQIETALVRAADEGDLPDPRRWAALIEQLGDERFARREAADRELRSLGRVIYTYLQQLDTSRLDAEQRYRVRRIVMALAARMDNDTPPEIAHWLAGDPAIWLALLERDDESTRRLAAERLESLLEGPVRFDPAADAETRQKQIEQLRLRVN